MIFADSLNSNPFFLIKLSNFYQSMVNYLMYIHCFTGWSITATIEVSYIKGQLNYKMLSIWQNNFCLESSWCHKQPLSGVLLMWVTSQAASIWSPPDVTSSLYLESSWCHKQPLSGVLLMAQAASIWSPPWSQAASIWSPPWSQAASIWSPPDVTSSLYLESSWWHKQPLSGVPHDHKQPLSGVPHDHKQPLSGVLLTSPASSIWSSDVISSLYLADLIFQAACYIQPLLCPIDMVISWVTHSHDQITVNIPLLFSGVY